jgi:hypothetical protein
MITDVKKYATRCRDFNEFFNTVHSRFDCRGVMKKNEFNRLVQVAAVEAELK